MEIRGLRVVVTGGAGFVGSHLVDRLLRMDNDVVVVDDLSSGAVANLQNHQDSSRLQLVEADVRDEKAMGAAISGADCVFHLATRNVRLSLVQPTCVHEVNTTGTFNVLKAAAGCGVRRLLYCSSSEVNGTARVVPMPEEYSYQPETIYGASKLTGEYYARVFHRAGWLPTIVARPHNIYGPRAHYAGINGEVIPRFILWALSGLPLLIYGDGRQSRDFTFVEEAAEFLVRLMECDQALGDTVNICRGCEVSVREIATTILELTGSAAGVRHLVGRPADVLRLCGDTKHLVDLLGKSPRIDLRQGLTCTIQWYRDHLPRTAELLSSLGPQAWDELEQEVWLERLPARRCEVEQAA